MSKINIPIEIRESEDGPRLFGTIVQEGRPSAVSEHAEVFAPNSVNWPANGIGIKTRHGQPIELRAMPTRAPDGSIMIAAKATPAIIRAVEDGMRGMSVEFRATEARRLPNGIREINAAFVESAALAQTPVYEQAQVEVREQRVRRLLWL